MLVSYIKALMRRFKGVDLAARLEMLSEGIRGTHSTYFLARDRESAEIVGLKLIDGDAASKYELRYGRLCGETAYSIDHPRVLSSFEHGIARSGEQYIISEHLDGDCLRSLITRREETLHQNRILLVRQMAEAVAAVHNAGFVHFEVCPKNFICNPEASSLKLIDVAMAVPMRDDLMQHGRVGPRHYLATEAIRHKKVDQTLDIFAWGVCAYEVCALTLPWPAGGMHDTTVPTPILEHVPDLDNTLAQAIMKCIAVQPKDRIQSAEQLVRALRRAT